MFSCDKCGYTTTDRSNFRRHCNRKVPCSDVPNINNSHPNINNSHPNINIQQPNINIQQPNINIDGFTVLNDKLKKMNYSKFVNINKKIPILFYRPTVQ